MSRRDSKAYLQDIRKACQQLGDAGSGKSREEVFADPLRSLAVQRLFEIIGEALSQLQTFYPEYKGKFSESVKIIGFRNRLIHGYFDVNDDKVWEAMTIGMPKLRTEVEALIGGGQGPSSQKP